MEIHCHSAMLFGDNSTNVWFEVSLKNAVTSHHPAVQSWPRKYTQVLNDFGFYDHRAIQHGKRPFSPTCQLQFFCLNYSTYLDQKYIYIYIYFILSNLQCHRPLNPFYTDKCISSRRAKAQLPPSSSDWFNPDSGWLTVWSLHAPTSVHKAPWPFRYVWDGRLFGLCKLPGVCLSVVGRISRAWMGM